MKIYLVSPGYVRQELESTCGYHTIRYCLERISTEIRDFEYQLDQEVYGRYLDGDDMAKEISEYSPDVVVHAPGDNYLEKYAAEKIRESFKGKFVCILNNDNVYPAKAVDFYDEVWVTSRQIFDAFNLKEDSKFKYVPHGSVSDNYYPVESEKIYDITFVGKANDLRAEYLTALKSAGYKININGSGWEAYPELVKNTSGYLLHYELLDRLSASKIVLNFAHDSKDGAFQLKSRIFEAASCGAFQICNGSEELENFFTSGKEIVTFSDEKDLIEKVGYYLSKPEERDSIAKAGYEKSKQHQLIGRYADCLGVSPVSDEKKDAVEKSGEDPLVTVICYTYNRKKYLAEMIESVQKQTFENFELLILDDGSTDGTEELVSKYQDDKRIKYQYQENIGRHLDSFDKLIERSLALTNGKYVVFMGADDIMYPERLAKQVADFEEEPSLDISFCEAIIINEKGGKVGDGIPPSFYQQINSDNFLRKLFDLNFIAHPTVMIKRESIHKAGGFQTPFASDYYFWLLTAKRFNYNYIPEVLLAYRQHAQGASNSLLSPKKSFTDSLLTKMRKCYTITDIFPDLLEDSVDEKRIAEAYLFLANKWIAGNNQMHELAIKELEQCLKYDKYNLQALNNLLVLNAMNNRVDAACKFGQEIEDILKNKKISNIQNEIFEQAKNNVRVMTDVKAAKIPEKKCVQHLKLSVVN